MIIGIAIIVVAGLFGFGLHTMEIEDHYGDLQEMYYDSKSGDIIVNQKTSEFGIIEKNWKRINIRTKVKDSTDLYNWIHREGIEFKTEVYRPKKSEINLNGITYSEIKKMIENSELKLISEN